MIPDLDSERLSVNLDSVCSAFSVLDDVLPCPPPFYAETLKSGSTEDFLGLDYNCLSVGLDSVNSMFSVFDDPHHLLF